MLPTDLHNIYIFQGVSASDLDLVALHATKKDFDPGEFIYHKGESWTDFHAITSGKVEFGLEKDSDFLRVIGQINSGDHFEELSMLTSSLHSKLTKIIFVTFNMQVIMIYGR